MISTANADISACSMLHSPIILDENFMIISVQKGLIEHSGFVFRPRRLFDQLDVCEALFIELFVAVGNKRLKVIYRCVDSADCCLNPK